MTDTPITLTDIEVQLSATLPCGCTLYVRQVSKALDLFRAQEAAERGGTINGQWFADRAPRHRCELVSEANPAGIAPRENPHG